jgi:hypothetical protein
MADVSQVIQMQRLRASAARRPVKNDKSITHLYQPQITSSGISEFLPNSKTKNTDARTINGYYYVPGIQAKRKLLPRNVFGITPVPIPTPLPFIGAVETIDMGNFVFTGMPSSVFIANPQLFPINVDTYYLQFSNIDPSFFSVAQFVNIQGVLPDRMGASDTVTFVNPTFNPVTSFNPGFGPNFITEITFNINAGDISASSTMIIKSTIPVQILVIRIY